VCSKNTSFIVTPAKAGVYEKIKEVCWVGMMRFPPPLARGHVPAFAGINFRWNDKGGKGNDWGEEL